jgi:NADH-quinone oxidoreductase subunit C
MTEERPERAPEAGAAAYVAAIGTVEQLADRFAGALLVRSRGDVADEVLPELNRDISGDGADEVVGEDVAGTVGVVVPHQRWHDALAFARDELELDFFDWLSAVDETDAEPPGFDIVAHLVKVPGHAAPPPASSGSPAGSHGLVRILVRTRLPEGTALASVTDLWPGAAWHERETFEMFGVEFAGFEDGTGLGLRPLLLPEGFEGTPLRKSFVLAARASKPWPGAKEPGESDAHPGSPSRRKLLPPGVPPATWGPRLPAGSPEPADE